MDVIVLKKKKSLYIILSVLILSLGVSFVDYFIKPDYFNKVIIKVIAFLLIPFMYFIFCKSEFKEFKRLFKFKKKGLIESIILGIVVYIGIVGGYFLVRNIFDFSNVTSNLSNNMGINSNNFLLVSMYLSFMNSFLEEFFFRGFGFITLKKYKSRMFGYIFSPLLFSIYHIGMMIRSFDILMLILLFIGLYCGGCVFNYLCERHDNIYPSWLVHMFSNFGINTVGFILFNM